MKNQNGADQRRVAEAATHGRSDSSLGSARTSDTTPMRGEATGKTVGSLVGAAAVAKLARRMQNLPNDANATISGSGARRQTVRQNQGAARMPSNAPFVGSRQRTDRPTPNPPPRRGGR